jgi:hypothetical protein
MRTVSDATLLVVDGPRGPYYAIMQNATGTVLTERTEQAAASLANDKDMVIVERREVSHAELLRLMNDRYDRRPPHPAADHPTAGTDAEHPAPSMGLSGAGRTWMGYEQGTHGRP